MSGGVTLHGLEHGMSWVAQPVLLNRPATMAFARQCHGLSRMGNMLDNPAITLLGGLHKMNKSRVHRSLEHRDRSCWSRRASSGRTGPNPVPRQQNGRFRHTFTVTR